MTASRWARWNLLLLLATLGAAVAASANGRSDRCYPIRVRAADAENRSRVFSAAAAKDLVIEVAVPDEAASRPVRVKLFTPRGALYQVLETSAGEDGAESGRRRRRGRTLTARFPVAGTHVTTFALFGEWRAEAYLEGAETACTRPLKFVIEE